jgi:hypothetical protein
MIDKKFHSNVEASISQLGVYRSGGKPTTVDLTPSDRVLMHGRLAKHQKNIKNNVITLMNKFLNISQPNYLNFFTF